jgi:peptide/nickel transport system substrate-binding protein
MLAGAAIIGLVGSAEAGKRHATRGGTLRFATRGDVSGLDPHRNPFSPAAYPMAAVSQGLLDLDMRSEPTPGIASEWDASKDLLTYTFKLRQGALFHNGREVDAAAVQWNYERIKDPTKSHPFMRSALENLKEVVALDKYTVRCHLHTPSAAFPADVVYYPCALIAPDSEAQANEHPISCGPFKFGQWKRYELTELTRFENYFETDAEGNSLPYLSGLMGRPKREDQVRLTALRAGEVDLIDNIAYAEAAAFTKTYKGKFQTWEIPTVATSYLVFNLDKGPFTDKRLRQAAAHAIDHEAIKQAVFYEQGETARSFYASASPWHTSAVRSWPEYDPDKARFLLRKANAVGTEVVLQGTNTFAYIQQTGELIQAMWTEVGFKPRFNLYEETVRRQKLRERDFHADSTGATYRFDPDGWFSRQILSTAPSTKENSGFKNERADKLIAEARQTADKKQRLELYGEIDSIVNEELPILYLHNLTLRTAGALNLKGYEPAISGLFSFSGGGIRTAWLA